MKTNILQQRIILVTLIIILVLSTLLCTSQATYAADRVKKVTVGKACYDSKNRCSQVRMVTILCAPKWTKWKYYPQPDGPAYLKKGDQVYYSVSGGKQTTSASFGVSVSYNIGFVSISANTSIGKAFGGSSLGYSKRIPSKGYYRLKIKKRVEPKIYVLQRRSRRSKMGKWSKWKNYGKRTTTNKSLGHVEELKKVTIK